MGKKKKHGSSSPFSTLLRRKWKRIIDNSLKSIKNPDSQKILIKQSLGYALPHQQLPQACSHTFVCLVMLVSSPSVELSTHCIITDIVLETAVQMCLWNKYFSNRLTRESSELCCKLYVPASGLTASMFCGGTLVAEWDESCGLNTVDWTAAALLCAVPAATTNTWLTRPQCTCTKSNIHSVPKLATPLLQTHNSVCGSLTSTKYCKLNCINITYPHTYHDVSNLLCMFSVMPI